MKINILIITFTVMLLASTVAKSAEVYPPAGPYRSVGSDVNQVQSERAAKSNSRHGLDYWKAANQANVAQMQNQVNQLPGSYSYRNKTSQQRNYQVQPVRPHAQLNPAQGNFPQVRGPVYGPNIPPAERYNYPNQAMQRPMNQYPPAWR
jgi:hypothetical protein